MLGLVVVVIYATTLAVPGMVAARRGLVVNVSSEGGRGYLFDIGYGVGKQAGTALALP